MKNQLLFLLSFFLFHITNAQHSIIPIPVKYESTQGVFVLENKINLILENNTPELQTHVRQFRSFLESKGISAIEKNSNFSTLRIKLNSSQNDKIGNEGYELKITDQEVLISANQPAGIFYGLQTFRQLLPANLGNTTGESIKIPNCKIEDYPRFQWRGLMMDVSRHFFSVADVKAFINKMSQYKFNVFHWHLTDDEGWRIEIKSLPKLTEIGAWRVERHGRFGKNRPYPKPGEKATYGGFYTQEEIKEVVKYAAERNITIVPEIDMPGHSMAALAAYPEFSTKKESKFVNPGAKFAEWYGGGKFKMLIENTLNPADEKVYDFIDKIFTEVAELFPGEYIHMGGDECYKGYWESDPKVIDFMKKNDIKDAHELQSYFVKRVEKIINSKGKKMIGWDEILEGGLAEGAAVMSWRGMKGGIEAAKLGHKVVMSPTTFAYLDYSQGDHSVENRIYADLFLEKSYEFEPVPEGIDPDLIMGGQGNLWAEVIPNLPYAFYMTYPRAFAIAETVWSPKSKKDWNSFIGRTEKHFTRFDAENQNICKAVYDPIVSVREENGKLICELKNSIPQSEIYYSIDNTYPVKFGKKYTGAFEIPEGNLSLRTQTFRFGKPLGRQLQISRDILKKRAKK